jgi:hypothetical protein
MKQHGYLYNNYNKHTPSLGFIFFFNIISIKKKEKKYVMGSITLIRSQYVI